MEGRRTANGCFGECAHRQTGNMSVKPGVGGWRVVGLLEFITYFSWPCAIPLSACLAVVRAPTGLPHCQSMLDSVIRVSICVIDFFPSFFWSFILFLFGLVFQEMVGLVIGGVVVR